MTKVKRAIQGYDKDNKRFSFSVENEAAAKRKIPYFVERFGAKVLYFSDEYKISKRIY